MTAAATLPQPVEKGSAPVRDGGEARPPAKLRARHVCFRHGDTVALTALGPGSTEAIEWTIVELKADHTIAIVTHDLQQAARISDHTAFLYLGSLLEFGPTEQVFRAPKDERTKRYVAGRFG